MIRALTLATLLASTISWAQETRASGTVEDRKALTFNEIERGFFFEARAGFWATFAPPALAGTKTYFSSGQALQVDMGFDIGERISPSIFFIATGNRMGSDYTGLSPSKTASGDYGSIGAGAQLKARLIGFDDNQEVKRTWIYVKGGGAAEFYSPAALLPNLDVVLMVGPGVEYFTRLRHFSLGLEANLSIHVLSGTFGFAIFPTVKYAF